jgi:lauroyl/myristoyl acyltransferase
MSAKGVTFVLTSCNRFDLLAETLETFLQFNTYPISEYVLVEDSGNDQVYDVVRRFSQKFRVILNNPPVGQIASIDKAYAGLRTPYIFHCEDDWRFLRSGLIEESIVLLDAIPEIAVVVGRRRGQNPGADRLFFRSHLRSYKGIGYRFYEREPGVVWGGYNFNPGLRRLQDYRRIGTFAAIGHEADISLWFLQRGMNAAYLEQPAYETTGGLERHLNDPFRAAVERVSVSGGGRQWRSVRLTRRNRQSAPKARFSVADATFLTELPALYFAARFLPEAKWSTVSRTIGRAKQVLNRAKVADRAEKIAAALGLPAERALAVAHSVPARRTEHRIQVLKELSREGWAANIALHGDQEIRSALESGKGAVLWVAHTAFNTQATKMALYRAGHAVSHLSRPEHGFSKSLFGIRFLNPMRWRAEAKYLEQRIVIDRDQPGDVLDRARRVLEGNGIVSITAGAWEGRHLAYCDLFSRRLTLATGAPNLAQATGAHLLPVFTLRDREDGGITVRVGARISSANLPDRDRAIEMAVRAFVDQLDWIVREYPDQWRGWDELE